MFNRSYLTEEQEFSNALRETKKKRKTDSMFIFAVLPIFESYLNTF